MSDGAAAVVIMSAEKAEELGLKPLARFVAYATSGCLPEEMGIDICRAPADNPMLRKRQILQAVLNLILQLFPPT